MSSITIGPTTLDTFKRLSRPSKPVRCRRCGLISFSAPSRAGLTRPCPRCLPGRLETDPQPALELEWPGGSVSGG